MPMDWEIREPEKRVIVRASGPVDLASSVNSMIEIAGSPGFQSHYAVLVDLSAMELAVSMTEVMEVGQALSTMRRLFRGRIAVLTSSTLHLRLAQLVSTIASAGGIQQRAFRDGAEAERWLLDGD